MRAPDEPASFARASHLSPFEQEPHVIAFDSPSSVTTLFSSLIMLSAAGGMSSAPISRTREQRGVLRYHAFGWGYSASGRRVKQLTGTAVKNSFDLIIEQLRAVAHIDERAELQLPRPT